MQIHEGFGNIATCWRVRKKKAEVKKEKIEIKAKEFKKANKAIHERSSVT